MTRPSKALFPAVLALAMNVASAQAPLEPLAPAPAAPDAGPVDETPSLWLVELAGSPVADGGSLATARAEKAAFRAAAAKAGVALRERYAFDTLFNGVSAVVSQDDVGKLARVAGVKAVWPVLTVPVPETTPSEPDLLTALGMTGASVAGEELGLTGRGVKVAVMDTGVDYHHPDLGGCFGPGCRVARGWDFVGDAFNADPTSPAFDPVAVADPDPDDCNGHGTHVAGIVGARASAPGGVTGVAPEVTFAAYRVFGCAGSTTSDIMIAAMEMALADGADVLNMSIGAALQWPQYPTAVAADRLVNRGVSVVASIGNSGADGLWSASAPGLGEKVIGVAAFDNVAVMLSFFTASPDDARIGYGPAAGAPSAPTSGSALLSRTGTPTSSADACAALPSGSLAGTVALVRRGTCSFYVKAKNAEAAGAIGVVLYNNVAGRVSPTVAGSPPVVIPVVAITAADGVLLNDRIAAGPTTLTWTPEKASFPNATGNLISSFSSWGLSPDLALKPDLGAPGGLIFSTYPLEQGGYATVSGTSMAAPHVAGAVALLLEALPRTPAQAVRGLLQNAADPHVWWGNPGLGFLDNVNRQGAGMLDVPGAATATARVAPSKLSLGESQAGPSTVSLTLTNDGATDAVYTLSHQPALANGASTFTPSFFAAFADVTFSATTVAVPAGASAVVSATITAPAAPDRGQYGGYLVVTPEGGGHALRVPYAGFIGDYQSIQAMAPTANGFPWLARRVGTSFQRQGAGATFTLAGGDVPFFLVHLDHQVRALRIRIQDAATGRSWHDVLRRDYVGRNQTATGFSSIAWDGITTTAGRTFRVPNGTYVAVIEARKALATDADPVETWTSPAFTIARP
ncbi:MAG TPA: S8 family serine peptidase [Anaeromyxobacter sp.]|nr:S8 family serine peptidase [Anaeromyxobacter sp.]